MFSNQRKLNLSKIEILFRFYLNFPPWHYGNIILILFKKKSILDVGDNKHQLNNKIIFLQKKN
jgi:hypothetical protein